MSDKNYGGPAFPVAITNTSDNDVPGFDDDLVKGNHTSTYGGMTLRDYFAAKAMATTRNRHPAFQVGDTILIAVMRAIVSAQLGDEIEVPDSLI